MLKYYSMLKIPFMLEYYFMLKTTLGIGSVSGETRLDAFVVQRAVDLDVGVRPPVVVALLQVEGVVLVGLVGGAADEAVENRRFVLDARTVEGG